VRALVGDYHNVLGLSLSQADNRQQDGQEGGQRQVAQDSAFLCEIFS
jgi:hypothetical protein